MKTFVRAFAFLVSRAPWPVVLTTLVLFGIFGYLSTQVEIGQGNEGLSPDNPELLAQDRITDLFGSDETQESVIQVIIRQDGGDVFTKEAYDLVTAIDSHPFQGGAPRSATSTRPSTWPTRPAPR